MTKKRDIEGNRLHHFELSDKNRTVRWVLIIILLVVAAVALTVGLTGALETPAGWQEVSVNSAALNCSEDFVLRYEYGAGEASATAESKALQQLYGKATEDAWKLFYNEAGQTDLVGIYAINRHPNEELTVDSGLYTALEQMVKSGSRALYLAPIYAEYDRVFRSESQQTARENDPGQNEQQRSYVQTLADFANDPQAIDLILRGENKVLLQVSQEYLTFVKDNEVRELVDFGWLRNAFIADYFADLLTEKGFCSGYIVSEDGFTRNLDTRGLSYSINVFHMRDNGVDLAAVMDYSAPKSVISLRSYPMHNRDLSRYYTFDSGRIVSAMIDPADGQSKSATEDLVSYSAAHGCGQLALAVMPVFVADAFSEDVLNGLTEQGIYSVWFSGQQLMHNQNDLQVTVNEPYRLN